MGSDSDLFDTQCLRDFLTSLTDETKRWIQSHSYKHQNGFVKIILKKNPDGSCYRLHYWMGELVRDQNHHDHGWHFASKILHGALKNISYVAVESTDDDAVYNYIVDLTKEDGRFHVSRSNIRYKMIEDAVDVFHKGEVYRLPPHVIHKGVPIEEHTITLMKKEPLSRPECNLYSLHDIHDGICYEPISMTELEDIFQFTISVLQT